LGSRPDDWDSGVDVGSCGGWLTPFDRDFVDASPIGPRGMIGRVEHGLIGGGCEVSGVVKTAVSSVDDEGVAREVGRTRLGIEGGGRRSSV
jgi:hypothetical protein